MDIFPETEFVLSEIYNCFYEDDYMRALVNYPDDRDTYADCILDEELYTDGAIDACMQTKNMR